MRPPARHAHRGPSASRSAASAHNAWRKRTPVGPTSSRTPARTAGASRSAAAPDVVPDVAAASTHRGVPPPASAAAPSSRRVSASSCCNEWSSTSPITPPLSGAYSSSRTNSGLPPVRAVQLRRRRPAGWPEQPPAGARRRRQGLRDARPGRHVAAIELGHVRLVVAAGRHERHRRIAKRSRQLLEHPDRHRVRPVEVVEDHDRRRRRAQRSGQRVEVLPPPVGGRDRRIVGRIDAERPVHPAPQLHRLADRRVGFAVQHPHPGRPGAVRRLVGEPGLADSRLANQQHDVRAAATAASTADCNVASSPSRPTTRSWLGEIGAVTDSSSPSPPRPAPRTAQMCNGRSRPRSCRSPRSATLEPGRQVVAHEYGRRLRHQHLPAPRRGHDPGGAIGPGPEVVVGGRGGRRRVQADAAAQRHPAGEPALTLDGCADRCDRVGEHRHETVPGVFDNFAPGRGDRRLDDPVVLGEFGTHRVRLAFPARRGALDVGEQEGDRPSRTNRHRGDDRPPAWSAAAEYSARPDQLNRRSTSPRSGSDRR